MAYQTQTGKQYEQEQDDFVDAIFYPDGGDIEKRIKNIGTVATITLKHVPDTMAIYAIAKSIAQKLTGENAGNEFPTTRQLDTLRTFLKHYKSRPILNEYRLNALFPTQEKTETELLREQVAALQSRVEALERYIFEATLKRQPDPDELPF